MIFWRHTECSTSESGPVSFNRIIQVIRPSTIHFLHGQEHVVVTEVVRPLIFKLISQVKIFQLIIICCKSIHIHQIHVDVVLHQQQMQHSPPPCPSYS